MSNVYGIVHWVSLAVVVQGFFLLCLIVHPLNSHSVKGTECTTILKENCSQICSKISGVDTCLCRDGYRLTEDDITCEGTYSVKATLIGQFPSYTWENK